MSNTARIVNVRFYFALIASALLMGCLETKTPVEAERNKSFVVATVGSKNITSEDIEKEIGKYKGVYQAGQETTGINERKFKKAFLDRLVEDTLLNEEADRLAISVTDQELDDEIHELLGEYNEAKLGLALSQSGMSFEEWKKRLVRRIRVRKLMTKEVDSKIDIKEDEIRAYFEAKGEEFKLSERVRTFQIMVEDETKAESIRKKLLNNADFAKIAGESSLSPDASVGGDLGYFSRGQMLPEFEQSVFDLQVDEISEVIRSIYGFHIFKVVSKKKPRVMKYDEARERIKRILTEIRREEVFKNWILELKKRIPVKINEKELVVLG